MLITCAPGKLILSGEHAVVHGSRALAGSIDGLYTAACLVPAHTLQVALPYSSPTTDRALKCLFDRIPLEPAF
ncbi:MAG: hypothetical protein SGCHY_003231, partial [Lobulomycetales sp.]